MSTPQDARARKRQKNRRAKKNREWSARQAAENAESQDRKPAKKAV
jgi:hypothetical protein